MNTCLLHRIVSEASLLTNDIRETRLDTAGSIGVWNVIHPGKSHGYCQILFCKAYTNFKLLSICSTGLSSLGFDLIKLFLQTFIFKATPFKMAHSLHGLFHWYMVDNQPWRRFLRAWKQAKRLIFGKRWRSFGVTDWKPLLCTKFSTNVWNIWYRGGCLV